MSSESEANSSEALDEALVESVNGYLAEYLDVNPRVGVTAQQIRDELVDPLSGYMMPITTSEGTQYQKWVVLNISKEKQDEFKRLDLQLKQRDRMAVLGLGFAALLGLTGVANRAFTRRKRRYPSLGVPPTTMPLLSAMAGHDHNQVHLVGRDLAGELPVAQAPRRRSRLARGLIFMAAVVMVVGLAIPALVVPRVHTTPHIEIHTGYEPFSLREEIRSNMRFGDEAKEINREIRESLRHEIREALGHE